MTISTVFCLLLSVNYLLNVVTKTKDNVVSVSAKKYQHQLHHHPHSKNVRVYLSLWIDGGGCFAILQANEEGSKKEKRNKIACR